MVRFLKLLEVIGWSIWLVGALFAVTGLANLFNNCRHWLKTGVWNPLTTYNVLRDLAPSWSWLDYPTGLFRSMADRKHCRVLACLVCPANRRFALLRHRLRHGYYVQVLGERHDG